TQLAPTICTVSLGSASQTVAASGGSLTVTVSAESTCSWTAASNVPWVTVTAGASGTGNGTVTANVASNSGAQRTGTLTIAGQAFTVTQSAASSGGGGGCSYSVSPTSQSFPSAGGAGGPVTVQTPVECQWTASSSDSWITGVTGGGSGPGQVRFNVAGNTAAARTGHLTIAGQTFTVTEGD